MVKERKMSWMRVCCLRNEKMWWIDMLEVRLLKEKLGSMHGFSKPAGIHRCKQDPQQGRGLEPTVTALSADLLSPDDRGRNYAGQSIYNPK